MISRSRIVLFAWILLLGCALAAAQTTKTAGATTQLSIPDLVLQGKTKEAVNLTVKSPETADASWISLFTTIDTQIVLRNLDQAKSALTAVNAFAEALAKTNRVKTIPRDAIRGRQLRLDGILLSDKGEYAKAVDVLKQALALSTQAKDRALEAGVHNNLGFAFGRQSKLADAQQEYDTARLIAEELKDNLRAGSSNLNLGYVLSQQQKFEEAMAAFKRSAAQNKAAGVPRLEALAIMNQGVMASKLRTKSEEVVGLLTDAEAKFEKLGDFSSAGWCYFTLAEYTGYGGDVNFIKTQDYGEKAIALFTKAGDKAALQKSYDFLSLIYTTTSNLEKSEHYKKLAQDLEKELAKDRPKEQPPVKK